jgi:hypothetical protein
MATQRTTDKMTRPKLREFLSAYYGGYHVYEELAIDRHTTVVDFAVFSQKESVGFEIKSGRDSFTRLPRQVKSYDKFFTRNYIVIDDNHLARAQKAVPMYWGILLAYHDGQDIVIEIYRDADINPNQKKRTLLELLWKEETKALLRKHDLYKGMSKARISQHYTLLNRRLKIDDAHQELYELLPKRVDWKPPKIG